MWSTFWRGVRATSRLCPGCGSNRLQSTAFQGLLWMVGLQRYQCLTCRHTVILRRFMAAARAPLEMPPDAPPRAPVQISELHDLDRDVARALGGHSRATLQEIDAAVAEARQDDSPVELPRAEEVDPES
jgi:hypothetical protein